MPRCSQTAPLLALLILSLARGQDVDSSASNWIHQTSNGVELVFKGSVFNADGSLADGVQLQVVDHPNPLANNPQIRNLDAQHGTFSFGSMGLSSLAIWASNAAGTQQAVKLIAKNDVATTARSGQIELQLERSRLLAICVKSDAQPVADSEVLVHTDHGLELVGKTGQDGIAKIYLPNGQVPSNVRAWTSDRRLGFLDFRDSSDHERKKTLHNIELSDCVPLTVRVQNEQGMVQAAMPIRLGVSNSKYQWVHHAGLFETLTDSQGQATFEYFPNWTDERHFLYTDDPQQFVVDEPQVIAGIHVYTVSSYERAILATFKLSLPKDCPGGMVIEGWSFQSKKDHQSTVFFSRVDALGRFQAPVVPGYTYHLFINDDVWVSKPMACILADPESGALLPLEFDIERGAEVTVKVTAGPDHTPLSNQWVHLETPHQFEWKEDGKIHSGSGGRRWQMVTDAQGEVHTRTYPGPFETRVSAGSSNLEKSVKILPNVVNELELHRETLGPTYVAGRLTADDPSAVLDGAKIKINQAESDFIKRPVEAVAGADGAFDARIDCSLAFAYALTADGNYSGATRFRTLEKSFQIELLKVGKVGGQVLDEQGLPIQGGEVFASATLKPFEKPKDAGSNWPWSLSVTRFNTKTDQDGRFQFDQLPAQIRVLIGLDTDHVTPNTFRSLDEVFLEPGEARIDNVYRPRSKNSLRIEDQFSQLLRNCQRTHTHALVLIGGNDPAVDTLRSEALDYDSNADVLWYLPLTMDMAQDGELLDEKLQLLRRRSWSLPKDNELLLVAVDGAGNELGKLLLAHAPNQSRETNSNAIVEFLAQNRIPQQDAREKLTQAIAEAKRTGRRVWARVGGTRCAPCIRMSNWLEDHRAFIEKAFVLVEVDALRDRYGQEVAEQLEQQAGIPWHVMLDADGRILVTSEAAIGNIGSPDPTPESLKHMRHMLTTAAAELLTPDEITALLETIQEL